MPASNHHGTFGAALGAIGAQAAAMQPIHWLIMVVAATTFGVSVGLRRLERLEEAVDTLTVIVCSGKPDDSHCDAWRRR